MAINSCFPGILKVSIVKFLNSISIGIYINN